MGKLQAKYAYGVMILLLVVTMILPACRREAPPLDRNIAPETFLTSSPPETTETDYRVHLYWHGLDKDGEVVKYMFYISDTLLTLKPDEEPEQELLDWNPALRGSDYRKGTFTTRTDSVFIFKGYDDKAGAMVNRQAFHIVAIDDGGKIDPTPARLQFLAKVRGIPKVQYWINTGSGFLPYTYQRLDTISMFVPFAIKFFATTVNNQITGYRWTYGGKILPDENNDGAPEWYIPSTSPPETVTVTILNQGEDKQPSGVFNFKVIARDEAGALSQSNMVTGEGICKIVINHDPDTRVIGGECFFTPQSTGQPESLRVDFNDGIPDTLPFGSILRLDYLGWDDKRDLPTLENTPPLPIRFQFRYIRWYHETDGSVAGTRLTPWYPFTGPEDTNPGADLDDPTRDQDSTSMRIGSYNYYFLVRSFDEQLRPDGTPDTVTFYGNFPPTIDSVGFYYEDLFHIGQHVKVKTDTIYLGWRNRPYEEDTVNVYRLDFLPTGEVTKYYKIILTADGHDDHRDPLGSDIKEWWFDIYDPDYDYSYKGEHDFIGSNVLSQEMYFKFTFPFEEAFTDSVVNNPPPYFGEQVLTLIGGDKSSNESFVEQIRGKTPEFDENGNLKPGQDLWIRQTFTYSANSKKDKVIKRFYIKLVY